MKSKDEILNNIVNELNNSEQKWELTVEGDQIIAYWKWKDGIYFSFDEITDEVKEYKFIVTLLENGKWKEKDITLDTVKGLNFGSGTLSFGKSGFVGNKTQKTIEIGFGKDRETGKTGIQTNKFDTSLIKEPIRAYLKNCGWKKKGLF